MRDEIMKRRIKAKAAYNAEQIRKEKAWSANRIFNEQYNGRKNFMSSNVLKKGKINGVKRHVKVSKNGKKVRICKGKVIHAK